MKIASVADVKAKLSAYLRGSQEGPVVVQVRNNLLAYIQTYGDMLAAASQLLGIRVRPRPGGVAERMLVLVQRAIAAIVRLFTPGTKA